MSDDLILDELGAADLVREAELLLARREPEQAIATLTRANRSHPSGELEANLVRVRTEAFDAIDRVHGRDAWPRTCPDPFPDVSGTPPEIHRRDLDADLVAGAVGHHGSLIVRELVTPDDIAELRGAIQQAFDARKAFAAGDGSDASPYYEPFDRGRHHEQFGSERFVRIIDSPRTLFTLLEIYEHLGERPALSAHKCALRRLTPNADERSSDYHQDGSFLGANIRTANVWLTLSDCGGDTSTTAGLDVIPTRIDHILDTGVDGAMFDWTISESTVARAAGASTVVRPVFAAGDAMIFDELMVHRTGLSEGMVDERMAIEAWFFAPSEYPDDHVPILV